MKPIKLIISAFGPYADKMEPICFEEFEEKGLFLISGATGSGKTTIFDAIVFALFGKTSGTYRSTKCLKSEYADENVKSYVDFYFSHQGKDYHILRTPAYTRINRNGRETEEAETAILYIGEEESVEGLKKVDSKVKEILNFDADQFRQIAMIAQGDFWKLLNTNTKERTDILRSIFQTGKYKRIEDLLKVRKDNAEENVSKLENSILQYFLDTDTSAENVESEHIESLKSKARGSGSTWNLEELIDSIDRYTELEGTRLAEFDGILKEKEAELEEISKNLATAETSNGFIDRLKKLQDESSELESKKPEIEEIKSRLKKEKNATYKVSPKYDSWKNKADEKNRKSDELAKKKEELSELKKAASEAEGNLKTQMGRETEASECETAAALILNDKAKYENRDQLKKDAELYKSEVEKLEKAGENLKKAEDALKEKTEKLKAEIAELKDCPAKLVAAESEKKATVKALETASKLLDESFVKAEEKTSSLETAQKAYKEAFEAYKTANDERVRAEGILEGSRAGILASKLVEGQACPVCGSTHHPKPAELPEDTVSEEEFKAYQENETSALEKKNSAFTAAEKEKGELDLMLSQLRSDVKDFMKSENAEIDCETLGISELKEQVEKQSERLSDKKDSLSDLIEELETSCRKLETAEENLEKAEGEETDKLKEDMEKLSEKTKANSEKLSNTEGQLTAMENLKYSDWENAKTEMEGLNSKAKAFRDAIRTAEQNSKNADEKVAGCVSSIETMESDEKKLTAAVELLEKELNKALKEYDFESAESMKSFVREEEELQDTEKAIADFETAVSTNITQLDQAKIDAEGKTWTDMDSLKQTETEKKEAVDNMRDEKSRLSEIINQNMKCRNNMADRKDELEAARKTWTDCTRLYKLVRGQVTNANGKITLEQYVQASGFDGIIRAANRRLLPMSDNQFELFRKESATGNSSQEFLDLEVLDNNTGKRRPVGNLSGGESFKASLSLALGLSDTVSSHLGGIQMDALFIDEGFGTLDKKSIDSAMDILFDISGKNKLVGVISHREELIENIKDQIVVTKDLSGSKGSTFTIQHEL